MKNNILIEISIFILLLLNTIITLLIFMTSLHQPETIPSFGEILGFPSVVILVSILLFSIGMIKTE